VAKNIATYRTRIILYYFCGLTGLAISGAWQNNLPWQLILPYKYVLILFYSPYFLILFIMVV